jgi:hypothetical protein
VLVLVLVLVVKQALGEQKAWENRTSIYLAAAAGAEFIADLFLCPLEAVRIRSVSDPSFPQSLGGGFAHILKHDGLTGFYAGLGPILFKQVPYTMAKFAVQGLSECWTSHQWKGVSVSDWGRGVWCVLCV